MYTTKFIINSSILNSHDHICDCYIKSICINTVKKLNTYLNVTSGLHGCKRCLVMFSNVYHIINNSIHIYQSTKHLNTNKHTLAWEIKKSEKNKNTFFFSLYKAVYFLVFRCLVKSFSCPLLQKTDQTQVNITKHLLLLLFILLSKTKVFSFLTVAEE